MGEEQALHCVQSDCYGGRQELVHLPQVQRVPRAVREDEEALS